MQPTDKFDRMLRTLVTSLESATNDPEIDIVVQPSEARAAEGVAKILRESGGVVTSTGSDAVYGKLPASKLVGLADNSDVSRVRMQRLHRMH